MLTSPAPERLYGRWVTRDFDAFRLAKARDLPRLTVVEAARFAPHGAKHTQVAIITPLTIVPAFFWILGRLATRDLYTSGRNEYVTTSPASMKWRTLLIVFAPIAGVAVGVPFAASQRWPWCVGILLAAAAAYAAPFLTESRALRNKTLWRALRDQTRAMRDNPGHILGAAKAPGADEGTIDRFCVYVASHRELHPCYAVAAVEKLAVKYEKAGLIPIGSTGLAFRSPSQQERDEFKRVCAERAG